jgi:signal transduction histidine kinase/HD-like signal output (HDOD) protein
LSALWNWSSRDAGGGSIIVALEHEQGSVPPCPARLDGRLEAGEVDTIVRELDSLPTIPAVAARLLSLMAQGPAAGAGRPDDREAQSRLVSLVECDPALTAKLLSMANCYGPEQVGTVAEAVDRVGFAAARSAAVTAQVFGSSDKPLSFEAGLDLGQFWRHCLAVACAAEMLSPLLNLSIAPEKAFVCGLLHDIGKLALLHCLPKSYARAVDAARTHGGSIADCERRIIGVDHCLLGRRLADWWRLPGAVGRVAWLHHQPLEAIPESMADRRLIGAVGLADAIACQRNLGFSGSSACERSVLQLAGRLGLGQAALAEVTRQLSGRLQERANLLGLGEPGGEGLYHQALADANVQLAHLNEELRRRAAKVGGQAKAFRHMQDFVASLRPDAVIGEILAGVARVIGEAAGNRPSSSRPVVAYSISEEDKTLLAVRWDGSDDRPWRILALREEFDAGAAVHEPAPASGVVPLLLADPSDLGEWLDLSACQHQALICAGSWNGGVFCPVESGEAADEAQESCRDVASAVALALGIAQSRAKAVLLSEQMAGASQVLAESQEALAQARTLEAVGQMAAGAAHELNTPLAVVSGRAQLMRDRAKSDDERNVWQLIAEQAQRISDVLTELMEFASPQPGRAEVLELPGLLKEAAEAFASCGHPQAGVAKVDITTGADTPPALANRLQIHSAIVELIKNAAAASPRAHIRLTAEYDGLNDAVLLKVSDNGPGMDEETLAGAFTPFFSHQQAGRRLGMGLPKAKRYVEINGGAIRIQSRPGEGTTVFISLPPARQQSKPGEV